MKLSFLAMRLPRSAARLTSLSAVLLTAACGGPATDAEPVASTALTDQQTWDRRGDDPPIEETAQLTERTWGGLRDRILLDHGRFEGASYTLADDGEPLPTGVFALAVTSRPLDVSAEVLRSDYVWVSTDELVALAPADAGVGQRVEAPSVTTARIARCHLAPFDDRPLAAHEVVQAELSGEVVSTAGGVVRVRLRGRFALEGDDGTRLDAEALGWAGFDRELALYTAFELVVVGARSRAGGSPSRVGWAFELASAHDREPPRWIDDYGTAWAAER